MSKQHIIQISLSLKEKMLLCIESPLFAFVSIFLLQFKRVWEAWIHKDLTYGDTAFYYMIAYGWVHEGSVEMPWSPLYTAYYGTLLKIFSDIYLTTLLHRYIIVFLLSIMVLALMRRLLPAYLAWWLAAWWVVLPINFNSLYEVHLFAVILPLAATLVVLYQPGTWSRGIALGMLIISTMLVRNEFAIATGLWALICLIWEIWQGKKLGKIEFKSLLIAYGIPILLSLLIVTFFYWRSFAKDTPERFNRHTMNVCQIYSFGYKQRHTDWEKSPWTECHDLMMRDFGHSEPSFLEAIKLNPKAVLKHLLWNLRLTPAGLQIALFNATSDHANPDYVPVVMEKPIVLIPSLISLALLITAAIQVYRHRQYWWNTWLKERSWGWLMLFCLSAVMFIVIPMQRPRPSYMFMLTLTLMALIGTSFYIIIGKLLSHQRNIEVTSMMLATVLICLTPSYFINQQRPLLSIYDKIAPSENFIGHPETGIVSAGYPGVVSFRYGGELCHYFTKNSNESCIGYTYDIFKNMASDQTVSSFLRSNSPVPIVTLIIEDNFFKSYVDNPAIQSFLQAPENEGWKLVAFQDNSEGRWAIYVDAKYFNLPIQ